MYIRPNIATLRAQTNLLMTQSDNSPPVDSPPGLNFSEFICGDGSQTCLYQGPADFFIGDCIGANPQHLVINSANFLFSPDPNNPAAGIINESNEHIPVVINNISGSFSGSITLVNFLFSFVGPGEHCIADVQIDASGILSQQSVTVHLDETFTNIHAAPNAVCNATGQTVCIGIDFEGTAAPIGQGQGG